MNKENFLKRKKIIFRQKGYSLLELVLVIALLGIIIGVLARMMVWGVDIFSFVSDRKDVVQSSRIGIKIIKKDLRKIKSSNDISNATNTQLTFINMDNETVSFTYSSGDLTRNTNELIEGLDSFYFTFYDADGDTIATPVTDPTTIWKIKFKLHATVNSKPWSIESITMPRNIR